MDHMVKISLRINPEHKIDSNGFKRNHPFEGSYVECLILSCGTIERRSILDTTLSPMD